MARPRRQYQGTLSAGQAQYVLERLIGERRVSATEIERYVGQMGREISDLEQRLARLRDAAGPAAAAAAAGIAAGVAGAVVARAGRRRGRPPGSGKKAAGRPGRPPGSGKKPGRPPAAASNAAASGSAPAAAAKGGAKRGRKARAAITPEQLASRQLQGRYLALVRQFPENKRAQYAKIAKEKGREAAINQMQSDSKK